MKTAQVLAVLLYMVYSVHSQTPVLPFACFQDSDCQAGGDTGATCGTDGACTCTTHGGSKCETTQAQGNVGTCGCDTTGAFTCDETTDPAAPTCICNNGYTGATCNTKTVILTCEAASATISILPQSGFLGKIYFLDTTTLTDDPDLPKLETCPIAAPGTTGDPYIYTGYSYTAATAPCVNPFNTPAVAGPPAVGQKYDFRVYVQYYQSAVTSLDRVIKFTCQELAVGGFESLDPTSSIAIPASVPTAGDVVSDDIPSGVTLTVVLDDGADTALGATTPLGTKLKATILLPDTAAPNFQNNINLKDFGLYSYDPSGTVPAGAEPLLLVENGCVPAALTGLVTEITKETSLTTISTAGLAIVVKFKVVFPTTVGTGVAVVPSGDLYVRAEICLGDCTPAPTCAAPDHVVTNIANLYEVPARRKRDADISNGEVVNLLVNFTVGVPSVSRERTHETVPQSEDCYTTLAFILPLVMMAVLLLLALIMVYVFFTKLTHARNGGMNGETNMAYKS